MPAAKQANQRAKQARICAKQTLCLPLSLYSLLLCLSVVAIVLAIGLHQS
jgi:hypothetical protein